MGSSDQIFMQRSTEEAFCANSAGIVGIGRVALNSNGDFGLERGWTTRTAAEDAQAASVQTDRLTRRLGDP